MSGDDPSGALEVIVEPRNDRYDPDDDGWRDQAVTLYADLDAHVDTSRRARPTDDVRWVENGVERSVTLTGQAVDDKTVREIAKAAVAQVGGPPWSAGTGPS
jgi:hypothetical protein